MTLVAAAPQHAAIDVSVLVPAKDEAENLPLFMEQAAEAFANSTVSYEVVVIDDGSADDTERVLADLQKRYPFLRVARHRRQRGIADALRTGYLSARGRVLVFYPADLQYKPEDIPRLVAPILAGESDMVTGYKQGVYDKAFVSTHLQWAEPLALRHSRARSELREGVSARSDGDAAGATRIGIAT